MLAPSALIVLLMCNSCPANTKVSVTVAPLSWRSAPCAGILSRLSTAWCLVTPGIALSHPLLSHRLAPLVLWWRLHLNYPWNPRNLRSFSPTMRNPLTPQLKTPHIILCEAECQHLIDFYCCFVTPYNSKPILDTLCETATLLM